MNVAGDKLAHSTIVRTDEPDQSLVKAYKTR